MTGSTKSTASRDVAAAAVWTLIIFATVPYAQIMLHWIGSHFGGDRNIANAAGAVLLAALAVVVVRLIRRHGRWVIAGLVYGGILGTLLWHMTTLSQAPADSTLTHLEMGFLLVGAWGLARLGVRINMRTGDGLIRGIWFAAIAAGYLHFMRHLEIASEKIHFLEYGILALLLFRAVRHGIQGWVIYIYVISIGYAVGLIDESLQSLIASRVSELDDTLWDLAAVLLAVVGHVEAWRPGELYQPVRSRHVWGACATLSVTLLAGAAFVQQYTDFGHTTTDPGIGSFNSAFTTVDLAQIDLSRGREAAAMIDADEDTTYSNFLKQHTSRNDPYVHEARVHIFRRDKYLVRMRTEADTLETRLKFMHVAVMENRILEKYFPTLCSASSRRRWTDLKTQLEGELAANQALLPNYESAVGKRMITSFDSDAFWPGTFAVIAALCVIAALYARRSPL